MLNREKHQLIMGRILKDIYTDVSIATLLGFKGGTAAYFFYNLPRFSVDLDFDLFEPTKENQKLVFEKIQKILEQYGRLKDKWIKRSTVLMELSYGEDDHNIKIEISTRKAVPKEFYELKDYLGISMYVAKQDYLFASKLSALTLRTETAMRDVYDIYFFAKNNWDINYEIVEKMTGKNIKGHLADCVSCIEEIKDNRILQGLGELVSEKEKDWIRTHLKSETSFMLRNYISALRI